MVHECFLQCYSWLGGAADVTGFWSDLSWGRRGYELVR